MYRSVPSAKPLARTALSTPSTRIPDSPLLSRSSKRQPLPSHRQLSQLKPRTHASILWPESSSRTSKRKEYKPHVSALPSKHVKLYEVVVTEEIHQPDSPVRQGRRSCQLSSQLEEGCLNERLGAFRHCQCPHFYLHNNHIAHR